MTTTSNHRPHFAIDDDDEAIIAAIHSEPLIPFRLISERTGIPERTVARRYKRLHRLRAIHVRGRTLPGFAGTVAWMVRVTTTVTHAQELAAELARHDRTRWVRVSTARNEVIFGLISPSSDTDPILRFVSRDAAVTRVRIYHLLQTWNAQGDTSGQPSKARLDDLDQKILRELAIDGRVTHASIAATLGVSARTVTKRITKLVDEEILYFEADTAPSHHQETTEALIWAAVAPGKIRALATKLAGHPNFPFIAATSGPYALILSYAGPNHAELIDVIDTYLADFVTNFDLVPLSPALKRGS